MTKSKHMTLTITFESDWHIGSGAGIPKYIDRLVLRDWDELPYIPGKSLTGILRDAAERLADVYAIAGVNGKQALVNEIFGATREKASDNPGAASKAKIKIRPARLAPGLRAKLSGEEPGKRALREAFFSVQPGVMIDPNSGRAKDDHLFFLQKTRKGCVLEAELILEDDKHAEFLDQVVKTVRVIGAKRRRGAGRCAMKLTDAAPPSASATVTGTPDGGWTVFDITLTAETPTLIREAVLGNVVRSLDHIPGTLLLGPLLKANQGIGVGDIQVGPFHPALETGPGLPVPGLPVPLSFFHEKEEKKAKALNLLVAKSTDDKQRKGYREGYIDAAGTHYCDVAKHKIQQTHNTIDDAVQRPTEAVGGVYTYEAMPARQVYRGQVRVCTAALKEQTNISFPAEVRVGASKKDDYGLMRLEATPGTATTAPADGKDHLNVYLRSDLLLPDAFGGYTADPERLKETLEKALGVTLAWATDGEAAAFSRTRRIESWQAKWGLPRPTLVALQAGSVFRFKVSGMWDGAKAATLQRDGLGDRRAEGFGQVMLNPAFLAKQTLDLNKTSPGRAPVAGVDVPEDAQPLLLALEATQWKRHIRVEARKRAFDLQPALAEAHKKKKGPTRSQWGALRAAASTLRAPTKEGRQAMGRWLGAQYFEGARQAGPGKPWTGGEEKAGTQGAWPNSRAEKWTKHKDWRGTVLNLVLHEQDIWRTLKMAPPAFSAKVDAADIAKVSADLWAYAVRAYTDAITEAVFDIEREDEGKKPARDGQRAHAGN